MWMIATPSKPGWCRCLWWFFAPPQTASKRTKTLARLPTWLDHQVRSAGWQSSHSVCSKIPGGSRDFEIFIRGCLVQLVHCGTHHEGLSMKSPCSIWQPLTAHSAAAVFDGDNVFLHGADRIAHSLEQETGSKWRGSYFMPAQADR